MQHFFKPLRRKLGLVTLLFGCLFLMGWMTSASTIFELTVNSQSCGTHLLASKSGRIDWFQLEKQVPEWKLFGAAWGANPYLISDQIKLAWFERSQPDLCVATNRFIRCRSIHIWYGYFVVPLAIVSAWLLLGGRCENQSQVSSSTRSDPSNHPSNEEFDVRGSRCISAAAVVRQIWNKSILVVRNRELILVRCDDKA